jgi:hypothetical protein
MMKPNVRRVCQSVTVLAMLFALPTLACAGLVQVTFNDLSAGSIAGQSVGGTGLAGSWDGGANVMAIAGDLVAPASTNFALTQSGTAQSARGDIGSITNSIAGADIATPLTGTVWFSFLVNPVVGARGGLDINSADNATSSSGAPMRIIAVENQLRLITSSTNDVAASVTFGQTSLVLGRIDIAAGAAAETLSVWVNPDVENLDAADFVLNTVNFITTDIFRLGVESYRSGGTVGGVVDLITLSDRDSAYEDVTGFAAVIPAPAALPAGLGLLGLISLRRRKSN